MCASLSPFCAVRRPGGPAIAKDPNVDALMHGAMSQLVQAMDRHAMIQGVQEMACMALWALLTPSERLGDTTTLVHPEAKAIATAEGAARRITAARQRFAEVESVRNAADGALGMLLQ